MSMYAFLLVAVACHGGVHAQNYAGSGNMGSCSVAPAPYKAIAVLQDNGTVTGTIRADQASAGGPVTYTGQIRGLAPNTQHGFHIHWFGDVSNVSAHCQSAGLHFNPTNMAHGDISAAVRHVGDLGNIMSDANGVVNVQITDSVSQLVGANSVFGRMFVVHQDMDDLGLGGQSDSLTNGHSGARVACGIIGYRNDAS